MEAVRWYVLTGTRGGRNRVRILRAVDDQPRNATQLAEQLELGYTTVRYHLGVLDVADDVLHLALAGAVMAVGFGLAGE